MTFLYTLTLLFVASLAGCGTQRLTAGPPVVQTVSGTVRWKPAYDGEDAWYITHPPDTSSRLLPGAVVGLVKYSEKAILAKNIVAETHTDEFGKYELKAVPGRYWLTVYAPNGRSVVVSMTYPSFPVEFLINTFEEIEIRHSESRIHDFVIGELGTM